MSQSKLLCWLLTRHVVKMTADIDQPLALSTRRDPETQKRMTLKSSLPERASLTEKKKGFITWHNEQS